MILSQQRMALMLIGYWERGAEDFVGLLAFFPPLINLLLDKILAEICLCSLKDIAICQKPCQG